MIKPKLPVFLKDILTFDGLTGLCEEGALYIQENGVNHRVVSMWMQAATTAAVLWMLSPTLVIGIVCGVLGHCFGHASKKAEIPPE